MKTSNDLFDLIRSLSKSEKWHFKVYAGRMGRQDEKNYILLFDALDKQAVYNEAALLRKFKGQTFAKHLPATKTYLYKLILSSLEANNMGGSPLHQVKQLINQIEVLYHKKLYTQGQKLLRKAQKIAGRYELSLVEQELSLWEQRLAGMTESLGGDSKVFEELTEKEAAAIKKYAGTRQYAHLQRKIYVLYNRYGMQRSDSEVQKEFEAVFEHPFIQDKSHAQTVKARSRYYTIRIYYHLMRGETSLSLEHAKKVIAITETYPEKVIEERRGLANKYIADVYSYLGIAANAGRYDAYFEQKLNSLKKLPPIITEGKPVSKGIEAMQFSFYYSLRLQHCIATARFDEGLKAIKNMHRERPDWPKELDISLPLEPYMNVGLFYFCYGNYGQAQQWFSQVLNSPTTSAFHDIYSWVKVLSLVIHFELGHERILESAMRSTYRYLARTPDLFAFDKLILQFFRKELAHVTNQKTLNQAFEKLYRQLDDLSKTTNEIKYDHLLLWLQSRIRKKPLPDIIREKAKEKK